MMKIRLTVLPFIAVLLLFACSKSNKNAAPAPATGVPEVATDTVITVTMRTADISGTILNTANGSVTECGFVVSESANPALGSAMVYPVGTKSGSFSRTVDQLAAGTSYHVRAYAKNDNGVSYGRDIHFVTSFGDAVVTKMPAEINGISAKLYGQTKGYDPALGFIMEKGFVWSTAPGPLLGSSESVASDVSSATLNAYASGLEPATTYYMRAYAKHYFGMSYGEEISFKTAGYTGPSGGIVVLDKGNNTGGWRYLEAAPEDITYGGTNLFIWGCAGSTVGGTSYDLGAGPDNTARILLSGCGGTSGAAKRCDTYVFNGKSDWFLPAAAECSSMLATLNAIGEPLGTIYWSSSESDAYRAAVRTPILSGLVSMMKGELARVRAVRRY